MQDKWDSRIKEIKIFNASHVTRELAGALLATLRAALWACPEKITTVNSFDINDYTALYIIICPAGLGDDVRTVVGPPFYITYQLEAYHVFKRETYRDFLNGALDNWDYSSLNASKGRELWQLPLRYVPVGFSEPVSQYALLIGAKLYADAGRDIDVLFLGHAEYPRRQELRTAYADAGIKATFACGLDPNQMKDIINRAKIVINVHMSENFILETVRLNLLLSNLSCIVSEESEDTVAVDTYRDSGIIFIDYADFIPTCHALLADFPRRKRHAHQSLQWYRSTRQWNNIVDFPALLPEFFLHAAGGV